MSTVFESDHCKLVADGTSSYESNEERFLAAYPQAELGHTALLHAINSARRERGDMPSRLRRNRQPTSEQADE